MSVNRGDRVQVVLDVVPETENGERYNRVFVRGVCEWEAPAPERMPGAIRNTVGCFLGMDRDMPALRISCGPELFWTAAADT